MHRNALVAAASVAALLLAGCSGGGSGATSTSAGPPAGTPLLQGFVLSEAVVPIVGASVRVLDTNATTLTDKSGHFAFAALPVDKILIAVATKDGYTPTSKQVSIPSQSAVILNFTMAAVPTKKPFVQQIPFKMFLACEVATEVSGQNQTYKCDTGGSTGAGNVDQWEIPVTNDLAGAVIELFWTTQSPLGSALHAKLETLDLGQLNVVLAEKTSTSPLRIIVPEVTAKKYYTPGGKMKLTVRADPNNDANEVAAGAGVVFEQQIDAYASLFYVAPPPSDYTIANNK
jgi:hypothetical protein